MDFEKMQERAKYVRESKIDRATYHLQEIIKQASNRIRAHALKQVT